MNLPITTNTAFAASKPNASSGSNTTETNGASGGQFGQIFSRQLEQHAKAANDGVKNKPEKSAQPPQTAQPAPKAQSNPSAQVAEPTQPATQSPGAAAQSDTAAAQTASETAPSAQIAPEVLALPQQPKDDQIVAAGTNATTQAIANAAPKQDVKSLRSNEKDSKDVPSDIVTQPTADQVAAAVAALSVPQQTTTSPAIQGQGANSDATSEVLGRAAGDGITKSVAEKFSAATPAVSAEKTQNGVPTTSDHSTAPKADSFMSMMAAVSATQTTSNASTGDLNATPEMLQSIAPAQTDTTAAAMQTLSNAQSQTAATAQAPAQATVATPLSHPKWGDDFNQKITWLATQNEQSAELHLNPPQLGPIDVVLKVSGDQATAFFTSPHAAVRDAVEQALPKLRDMLADSGINLGNASVSDQAPRDQQSAFAQKQAQTGSTSGAVSDNITPVAQQGVRSAAVTRHNGLVDTFA